MSQLQVVLAQPSDLERYIDGLESVAAWLEGRGITQQWRAGFFRESKGYFAACIERGEVFLAMLAGEFAGTLRLLPQDRQVWPDMPDDGLYVHSLAVFRAWSGQKLGSRLLAWAEGQALKRGKRYVRLDCIASNPFLRRYYEDLGFEGRGERNARFPQGTYHLARYEKRAISSLVTQS